MNERKKKKSDKNKLTYFTALGLVFGSAIGLILSMIFNGNMTLWLLSGTSLGLIIGAIIDNMNNNPKNKIND